MVSLLRSVSAWATRAPSSAFSRKNSACHQRLRQPHHLTKLRGEARSASCANSNIIVRIMNLWSSRFSVNKEQEVRKPMPHAILGLHYPDHLTKYPKEFAMSKTAITSPELAPPVGP